MLETQPTLLSATVKAPPKKDDGQSALQLAIRNQQFDIANYLLDLGANVNFMEAETCCNEWRMPVLQDAITNAVMLTRWNVVRPDGTLEVYYSSAQADMAYALLKRMLELGADIYAKDSYGNSCLERAILQARQILPCCVPGTTELRKDRIITDELKDDLTRVFRLLFDAGASFKACEKYTILAQIYQNEPIMEFLRIAE